MAYAATQRLGDVFPIGPSALYLDEALFRAHSGDVTAAGNAVMRDLRTLERTLSGQKPDAALVIGSVGGESGGVPITFVYAWTGCAPPYDSQPVLHAYTVQGETVTHEVLGDPAQFTNGRSAPLHGDLFRLEELHRQRMRVPQRWSVEAPSLPPALKGQSFVGVIPDLRWPANGDKRK